MHERYILWIKNLGNETNKWEKKKKSGTNGMRQRKYIFKKRLCFSVTEGIYKYHACFPHMHIDFSI